MDPYHDLSSEFSALELFYVGKLGSFKPNSF